MGYPSPTAFHLLPLLLAFLAFTTTSAAPASPKVKVTITVPKSKAAAPLPTLGTYTSGKNTFEIVNKCDFDIWPGIGGMPGHSPLANGGFHLPAGQTSQRISIPQAWSGRVWGRTGCKTDSNGKLKCETGDCEGKLECTAWGEMPVTLAEFTMDAWMGMDFLDISLVDGYNLPMIINPSDPKCKVVSCPHGPTVLDGMAVRNSANSIVAVKNACLAYKNCVSGPNDVTKLFKDACPMAYSYDTDDATSVFTCVDAGYQIVFCP
ncbi:hypothetical protein HK104_001578 [Borealophlyctis nickersoniae]|nr:hypothetical protein HK104_001578 [Borealophlyctis nickersoniae]